MMKNRLPSYCCAFVIYALLILCMNSSVSFGHQCIESERLALLEFKSRILDDYGSLSDWSNEEDNKDCCKWSGVGCSNRTGHVIRLDLHGAWGKGKGPLRGKINLSTLRVLQLSYLDLSSNHFDYLPFNPGTIPYQLGNLSDLQHLDLSDNYHDIYGNYLEQKPIPNFIGFLTKLNYLDLSWSFGGTIPPQLGNLSNLHYLDLKGNANSKSVENLEWLSRLSNLETLDMQGVDLSKADGWVNVIMNLPSLSYLSLLLCQLSQVKLPYDTRNGLNANSSRYSSRISTLLLSDNNLTTSIYRWLFNISNNVLSLDLRYNQLTGQIPEAFGRMTSLSELIIFDNQIDGVAPNSLGNICNLTRLELTVNKLSGNLKDFLDNLSGCANATLELLDVGENNFTGSLPDNIIRFPSLQELHLENNQLNGGITENLGKLRNLSYLDLSSNSLQGVVADVHLVHLSKLTLLDLSSNQLTGDLFEGIPPSLIFLDLYRNKFSGSISSLCQTVDGSFLNYLDLSHNLLTGDLPDCLSLFPELVFLDVAHNKLTGKVPGSVGSLVTLEVMSLHNNGFYGELPVALTNCTKLNILKLGSNKLSGVVPKWIGANLFKLNVLSLRSNNFSGQIPSHICQLTNLSVIDLSMNRLSGKIPNCLNNLTSMAQKGHPVQVVDSLSYKDNIINAEVTWQGREVEFQQNLGLLKSIDLSSNVLSGEIPDGITDLLGLITLNLSRNQLNGRVPQGIGRLTSMCTLDLSRNMLSGDIPASMSGLSLLGNLDLSHNNLSGRIPSSTQLQSFDASTYVGNPGLCGPPLTKPCPGDELPSNTIGMDRRTEREGNNVFWRWFGSGAFSGFAVGFCGVCGALLLNRRWGDDVFMFLSRLKDLVIIKVILSILKVKELI